MLSLRIQERFLSVHASESRHRRIYPQSEKLIWSDITKAHFGMSLQTEVDHDLVLRAVHPDEQTRMTIGILNRPRPGGEGTARTGRCRGRHPRHSLGQVLDAVHVQLHRAICGT